MASSRAGAIINGLKAAQPPAQRPLAEGGISPLLASYQQWTMGRGQHQGLPRDALEFLAGAFGPLAPMVPTGLDQPPPGADRSEPRRFQYPVGWNLPHSVPGSEGLKLADFATLRMYADLYSVARSCIQLRKAEIRGLEWEIRPTPAAAKAMKGDKAAHRDFAERKKQAEKFFKRPDSDYRNRSSWMDALLEDVFVVDALSLYMHPTRVPGKGLLGSDLAALELIAGETIRPMLDIHGGRPKAPNPAYQQYLYGVPRVDLMTVLSGEDIEDLDGPVRTYRGDQLLYLPYTCRTWTPYGFPPIERSIIPTLTGLRKQQYQLNYFDEGTVPAAYVSPGENSGWTPSQIRELERGLNAIAGDPAWKHRILCLPPGSRVDPQHQAELADMMDEIVMTQVCMAFDVQPMELGISPRVSATQSSGAANQMAKSSQDTQERKATKPLLEWLKEAIFDPILQDLCGQDDMQYVPEGLEEDEDEETKTNLIVQQVSNALLSVDEGRDELGKQPWGTEESSQPGFITATGWVALKPPEPPPMVPGVPGQPPAGPGGVSGGSQSGGGGPSGGGAKDPSPRRPPALPSATPQHAAAAAESQAPAAKPQASAKALLAELDALRRHTAKGRNPADWHARYLPGWAVAEFRFLLKAGRVDVAGAADVVKGMLAEVPGHEGSQGPFPREYGDPHVYARDVHSGAGNCVCGAALADPVHVEAAPGVDVPDRMAVKVGPKGYEHNWHYIGGPGLPDPVGGRQPVTTPHTPAGASAPIDKTFLDIHYAGWRDNLTPAQDKALRFYQSPGFALMNGQLRGLGKDQIKADISFNDADLQRARKASRDLRAAIRDAPPLPHDVTVHRGFSADQFGDLKPGDRITDKGFVSTSITPEVGAVGRAARPATAEIVLPEGTRAAAGSARELVLPPGSAFAVDDVGARDGVPHVRLRLLP